MRNQKKAGVISALKAAVRSHRILTIGTLLCVAASVVASLIPPLLLKDMIDRLTGGMPLLFTAVLLYFGSLVLEGTLSSAQETLLVLFGQKMTHALRSEMSQKLIVLPASTLVGQNPGEVAARFSGDVDAVEALFTSGIISMAADACRIIAIMAVIAVKNTGIALVPQLLCNRAEPFLAVARQLADIGYREVNLNLGCPSGTVVSKHKGSGAFADLSSLDDMLADIFSRAPVAVSVKTRMGLESVDEFGTILEIYNKYPIAEPTIHARARCGL